MSMKQRVVRPVREWLGLLLSALTTLAAWMCTATDWHTASYVLAFVGFMGLFTEVANRIFYDRLQTDHTDNA